MKFRRGLYAVGAGSAAALMLVLAGQGSAQAREWSAHSEYRYQGGRYLQANVWMAGGNPFGYKTSAKYQGSGSGPATASRITNTVSMSVTGVGVSLGNFSGGTSSDKDFSSTYTNTNTWISDRAGTNSVSNENLYVYVTGSSAASAVVPFFGTPRDANASVQKWS